MDFEIKREILYLLWVAPTMHYYDGMNIIMHIKLHFCSTAHLALGQTCQQRTTWSTSIETINATASITIDFSRMSGLCILFMICSRIIYEYNQYKKRSSGWGIDVEDKLMRIYFINKFSYRYIDRFDCNDILREIHNKII